MSHFTLFVLGDNIDEQLLPFYEATKDKRFLAFNDTTEDVKKRWNEDTYDSWHATNHFDIENNPDYTYIADSLDKDGWCLVNKLTLSSLGDREISPTLNKKSGKLRYKSVMFYNRVQKKDGTWHFGRTVYAIIKAGRPSFFGGSAIIEDVLLKRVNNPRRKSIRKKYKDIFAYAKSSGYIRKNGKYGYYSNPNSKWDWYEVGGRWSGYFKGEEELTYPFDAKLGKRSIWDKDVVPSGWFDSIRKCDIDIDGMKQNAVDTATKYWQEYQDSISEQGRSPEVSKLMLGIPEGVNSLEEYIAHSLKSYICPFAILLDGKWYEKGSMGWWGIVSNEQSEWSDKFNELFDSIKDDELITLVDVHI